MTNSGSRGSSQTWQRNEGPARGEGGSPDGRPPSLSRSRNRCELHAAWGVRPRPAWTTLVLHVQGRVRSGATSRRRVRERYGVVNLIPRHVRKPGGAKQRGRCWLCTTRGGDHWRDLPGPVSYLQLACLLSWCPEVRRSFQIGVPCFRAR